MVSLISILLAGTIVHREWGVSLYPRLLLVLLGGLLVHAGSNLWNDYADERNGADRQAEAPSPFNGGSRVIQHGELSAVKVRLVSLVCFGGAMLIAFLLTRRGGWRVPVLALSGIILAVGYSSPPLNLNARGCGELTVAFCFGPLLAEGTSLALAGRFSAAVLWPSLPVGLLVASILALNALPDRAGDLLANKRTVAARWGINAGLILYSALLLIAFLALAAMALRDLIPRSVLATILFLPGQAFLIRKGFAGCSNGVREWFLPAAAGNVLLHLGVGISLLISYCC